VKPLNSLAEEIREEIRKHSSAERAEQTKKYFREPVETYGLSSIQAKEIAKKYYSAVKSSLDDAMILTEELLKDRNLSYSGVALNILQRFEKKIGPEHFITFDRWIEYLDNWAVIDQLCTHMICATIMKDTSLINRLLEWAKSENRWRRRASAVSLIPITRKGEILHLVFKVSDQLMTDADDMVQKGVGWLLKEASKKHPMEVRDYLLEWRNRTSSLILRYASEKLPKDMKVLKTRY
jgi:3-methyladenine DNA glycosylase AlkD